MNHLYRGFGLLIQSELELPELSAAHPCDDEPEVVIRLGAVPRVLRKATPDEELAIHNPGAGFLIRHGREIIVEPRPDADSGTIRVLLLGRVMAFLFRQRGWLPLHASGIAIQNQCVLFLGAPGAGKSTTAAAFYSIGFPVVTDDVAPVQIGSDDTCILQTSWPYLRLLADARAVLGVDEPDAAFQAGKHRYDLKGAVIPGNLCGVLCAYVIEYGEGFSAQPVDTLQATALLSRYSFVRRHNMSRESLQDHLKICSRVAAVIPVRRLVRPRSLEMLPALVRFVEEDIKTSATGTGRPRNPADRISYR